MFDYQIVNVNIVCVCVCVCVCVLAAPTITSSSSPSVNIAFNTRVGVFFSARQYPDKPRVEWTNTSGSAVASSDDFTVSNDGANVLHSTVSVNRVGRYICSIPNTQENKLEATLGLPES